MGIVSEIVENNLMKMNLKAKFMKWKSCVC